MAMRLAFNRVKEIIEQQGYVLCDKKYLNARTKMTLLCPQGHKYQTTWNKFQGGTRCSHPYCKGDRISKGRRLNSVEIQKSVEAEGYRIVSSMQQYRNAKTRLILECPEGHQYETCWNTFQRGGRCPKECKRRRFKENRTFSTKEIREKVGQANYKLRSEYGGAQKNILLECSKGHQYETHWNYFQRGHRCPKCSPSQSKAEREIYALFADSSPIEQDRTQIKPKELDLYFPDHSLAVEYCGLYWHSTGAPGDRITSNYHRNKLDLCNQKGIQLLTIFEDEWLDHKDICISRINNALGISSNRIYARNTVAKQIDKKEAKKFLNRTHLQGYGRCKLAFGLYTKDTNTLVSVMTWGSPARAHTAKGKKVLEMKRFASELNTNIVGGASKLLKLGLQYAKDNNYDSLKSYCDLRWGTGNLYKKLGFTKTYETKYTPHYTDGKNRYRNQVLAQNKKKTKKTEAQVAQEKGLHKIYDCGHSTWEYVIRQ